MSEFEEKDTYLLFKDKSSSYLHFIDEKSKNQLKPFINDINKKNHSIKLDLKF